MQQVTQIVSLISLPGQLQYTLKYQTILFCRENTLQ